MIDARQQRGMEIAATHKIVRRDDGTWAVPSQSGNGRYIVQLGRHCTCPDHETRACKCKHMIAVEYAMRREQHSDGTETVTERLTITKTVNDRRTRRTGPLTTKRRRTKSDSSNLCCLICAARFHPNRSPRDVRAFRWRTRYSRPPSKSTPRSQVAGSSAICATRRPKATYRACRTSIRSSIISKAQN